MKKGCFVYLMRMPDYLPGQALSSRIRMLEVEKAGSEQRKRELYFGWQLLEYAAKEAFGIMLGAGDAERTENGAVMLPGIGASLSHSGDLLAAAVCSGPVGIDVERYSRVRTVTRLAKKILTENEKRQAPPAEDEEAYGEFLIRCWCGKESLFKMTAGSFLDPLLFDTVKENGCLFYHTVMAGQERFQLCAAVQDDGLPVTVKALVWQEEEEKPKNTDISVNIHSFPGSPFML